MEIRMITVVIGLDEDLVRQAEAVLQQDSITIERAMILFFEWCVLNPKIAGCELLRWQRLQEEVEQDGH